MYYSISICKCSKSNLFRVFMELTDFLREISFVYRKKQVNEICGVLRNGKKASINFRLYIILANRKIKSSPFQRATVKNKTLYAKMINDDSAWKRKEFIPRLCAFERNFRAFTFWIHIASWWNFLVHTICIIFDGIRIRPLPLGRNKRIKCKLEPIMKYSELSTIVRWFGLNLIKQ